MLQKVKLSESISLGALPAMVYAVQNMLCQLGYQNLDFLSFSLLNQTKVLSTALFVYLFMDLRQTLPQCCALALVLPPSLPKSLTALSHTLFLSLSLSLS
jgi:UDP-sugar transporter A1/2/3